MPAYLTWIHLDEDQPVDHDLFTNEIDRLMNKQRTFQLERVDPSRLYLTALRAPPILHIDYDVIRPRVSSSLGSARHVIDASVAIFCTASNRYGSTMRVMRGRRPTEVNHGRSKK